MQDALGIVSYLMLSSRFSTAMVPDITRSSLPTYSGRTSPWLARTGVSAVLSNFSLCSSEPIVSVISEKPASRHLSVVHCII